MPGQGRCQEGQAVAVAAAAAGAATGVEAGTIAPSTADPNRAVLDPIARRAEFQPESCKVRSANRVFWVVLDGRTTSPLNAAPNAPRSTPIVPAPGCQGRCQEGQSAAVVARSNKGATDGAAKAPSLLVQLLALRPLGLTLALRARDGIAAAAIGYQEGQKTREE
ncbi:hypothetical protein MIND_00566900 [Mycena indigotica]|uniref:Uncharacterized protein n=1 Tax=Mycena indigotica TaxID=2126181 RepID=A0A8H6SPD5_9AGAR|nr:uncharacterized protein MIND_00566900 [Mycena indigotica]KAF7303388.1 hypothetical protein MIND_00566900 [Mycena indigotica]